MLKELDSQELKQVQALRGNQALMKLLRLRFDAARAALVHIPETDQFHVVQGQAQALRLLMKAIDPESVD